MKGAPDDLAAAGVDCDSAEGDDCVAAGDVLLWLFLTALKAAWLPKAIPCGLSPLDEEEPSASRAGVDEWKHRGRWSLVELLEAMVRASRAQRPGNPAIVVARSKRTRYREE